MSCSSKVDPGMGLSRTAHARARFDITDYVGFGAVVDQILAGKLSRVCLFTSKKRCSTVAAEVARRLTIGGGSAVLEALTDGRWLVRTMTASVLVAVRHAPGGNALTHAAGLTDVDDVT